MDTIYVYTYRGFINGPIKNGTPLTSKHWDITLKDWMLNDKSHALNLCLINGTLITEGIKWLQSKTSVFSCVHVAKTLWKQSMFLGVRRIQSITRVWTNYKKALSPGDPHVVWHLIKECIDNCLNDGKQLGDTVA
jgi:hypothetical protein